MDFSKLTYSIAKFLGEKQIDYNSIFAYVLILFHRLSGFTNPILFNEIKSEDIDSVERFIREDLKILFETKMFKLPYGSEVKDVFGSIYALQPSRFKFLPAERKLIEKMVSHNKHVANTKKNDESDLQKQKKSQILNMLNVLIIFWKNCNRRLTIIRNERKVASDLIMKLKCMQHI